MIGSTKTKRMLFLVVGVAFGLVGHDLGVEGFSIGSSSSKRSKVVLRVSDSEIKDFLSPLGKLNPFSSSGEEDQLLPRPPGAPPGGFASNPEGLIGRAKAVLAADMGIRAPSLLADNDAFIWIGPNSFLGKSDYLAAGKFFDLRAAFPDLDYRAHDFRIVESDPSTVRLTARAVGTMRGELRLRTETLPPNGKRMICPPEAISMTFDDATGQLTKLCSGFTMDRLVGNTAGLCGIQAGAVLAGSPPSEWEIYPPASVISRFFGRTIKQIPEPTTFLAPFPETVMVQLAKGVIAADNGASDPDLLAPSFTFCGPIVGPLPKDTFVEAFASFKLKEAFPDLDQDLSNFRVDPYDPNRVWVDVRGSGTRTGVLLGNEPNGKRYEGPPEAVSLTFDDDGFCIRLTAGVVMDPSIGNTGGLGGVFGIFYATDFPFPGWNARPLPQLLARLQKRATEPITKVGVDDYLLPSQAKQQSEASKPKPITQPLPTPPAVTASVKSEPVQTTKPPPKSPVAKVSMPSTPKVSPPKKAPVVKAPVEKVKMAVPPKPKAPPAKKPPAKAPPVKKAAPVAKSKVSADVVMSDPVTDAFSSIFGGNKADGNTSQNAAPVAKKVSPVTKKAAPVAKKAAQKAPEKAKQAEQILRQAKPRSSISLFGLGGKPDDDESPAKKPAPVAKKASEKAKQAEQILRQAKPRSSISLFGLGGKPDGDDSPARKAAPVAKKPAQKVSEKARQAEQTLRKSKPRSTISLFGLGGKPDDDDSPISTKAASPPAPVKPQLMSAAPRGVPTIRKWKQNRDKSISGTIFGSRNFQEGDSITTSAILSNALGGSLVQTTSGSRYYLEDPKAAAAAEQQKKTLAAERAKVQANDAANNKKEEAAKAKAAAATEKMKAAEAAKLAKKQEANAKAKAAAEAKAAKAKQAQEAISQAKARASIPLPKVAPAVAPKGVPTMSKWKQNRDGSVTGTITGSDAFGNGEKITTSPIANGEFEAGSVVQTKSGSRYFLN